MGVLSWGGLVSPKFSAPPSGETMHQTTKFFEVQERAWGPLSPCQVWCGSDFTRRRVAKNVEFFYRQKNGVHTCHCSRYILLSSLLFFLLLGIISLVPSTHVVKMLHLHSTILVLVSRSKLSSAPSLGSPTVDKERMRSEGNLRWLESMFWAPFSAFTPLVNWKEESSGQSKNLKRSLPEHVDEENWGNQRPQLHGRVLPPAESLWAYQPPDMSRAGPFLPAKLRLHVWRSGSHLMPGSLGPPQSTSQTASRSIQPFLRSSRPRIPILYNGPTPFSLKLTPSHGHLDPI